jgi:hypothetical protein
MGVTILEAKMGLWSPNETAATPASGTNNNHLKVELYSQDIVIDNFAIGTNSILDPKYIYNSATGYTIVNGQIWFGSGTAPVGAVVTTFADLIASSVYLDLVLNNTVTPNFVITGTKNISCYVELNVHLQSSPASTQQQFLISPLVVKYTW